MTTTMIERVYIPDLATSYPRPLFLVPVSCCVPAGPALKWRLKCLSPRQAEPYNLEKGGMFTGC